MEHYEKAKKILSDISSLSDKQIKLFSRYAGEIYEKKSHFNLTGHKAIDLILSNLIRNSIEPMLNLNVPRGTSFVDLGSGAGVPGIPLAILHENMFGVLVDSNSKKTRFMNCVVKLLELENVSVLQCRTEDVGHNLEFRGGFSLAVSRAMSDVYSIAEIAAPLLKEGGFLYLYTRETCLSVPQKVMCHVSALGFDICTKDERASFFKQDYSDGLLFKKISSTESKYPRRISIIKRESIKAYKV